jgi:hypothetical protein
VRLANQRAGTVRDLTRRELAELYRLAEVPQVAS